MPWAWSPEEGLFDEPERTPLARGDRVVVIAMDGDHRGRVAEIRKINGYPMVVVDTYDGIKITINRGHVVSDEEDDEGQGPPTSDL